MTYSRVTPYLKARGPPAFSATREVAVYTRKGLVGTVTVAVPFDAALVETLRTKSGLGAGDRLVVEGGAVRAVGEEGFEGRARRQERFSKLIALEIGCALAGWA